MKCYYNQVVKRLAGVAELADALDSGSSGSNLVEVQVLSPALLRRVQLSELSFLFCIALYKTVPDGTSFCREDYFMETGVLFFLSFCAIAIFASKKKK